MKFSGRETAYSRFLKEDATLISTTKYAIACI